MKTRELGRWIRFWSISVLIVCGILVPKELPAQMRFISIYVNGDVMMLVVDPLGRRLGYDPKQKKEYKEIPEGNIGAAGIDIVTDEGGEEDPSQVNPIEAMIFEAIDGEYQIILTGGRRGFFGINVRAEHVTRRPITNIVNGGIIDSGMVKEFRVHYDFADRSKTTITRVVRGSSLLEDLDTSFKYGLFKNKGIYTSLRQKGENAIRQHERGQKKAAVNLLQAFVQEVQAQTDQGIDKDAAEILLEDAQALIKEWS